MKVTVNKAKKGLTEVALTLLGLTVGKVGMNLASGKIPDAAVPAIGLTGLVPHFMENSSDELKAFGNGVTLAGAIDGFQKAKAKFPFIANLPFVSQVPSLAGAGVGTLPYNFGFRQLNGPDAMDEARALGNVSSGRTPLLLESGLVN